MTDPFSQDDESGGDVNENVVPNTEGSLVNGTGVLVVVPTYQEAENVERTLVAARLALPEAHLLVVDDSSPDGTGEIAKQWTDDDGNGSVLVRPVKDGLGGAYRTGFAWGLGWGFDVLCEMDCDGSHDPADLPRLLAPMAADDRVGLVIGSRYVSGGSTPDWPWHRRLLSKGGNVYAKVLLGMGVRDATAGFRAYRAELLHKLQLDSVRADGYGFQVEMTWRSVKAGAVIREVPIRFTDRELGTSKMSNRIVVEAVTLIAKIGLRERVFRKKPML